MWRGLCLRGWLGLVGVVFREDRVMVPKCRCGCYFYTFRFVRFDDKTGQEVASTPEHIVYACRLCDGDLVDRLIGRADTRELRAQDGSS